MTILEAVKEVEHREACLSRNFVSGGFRDGAPKYPFGLCDCDRDERIAKGIEAALKWQDDSFCGSVEAVYCDNSLEAFVQASGIPKP